MCKSGFQHIPTALFSCTWTRKSAETVQEEVLNGNSRADFDIQFARSNCEVFLGFGCSARTIMTTLFFYIDD